MRYMGHSGQGASPSPGSLTHTMVYQVTNNFFFFGQWNGIHAHEQEEIIQSENHTPPLSSSKRYKPTKIHWFQFRFEQSNNMPGCFKGFFTIYISPNVQSKDKSRQITLSRLHSNVWISSPAETQVADTRGMQDVVGRHLHGGHHPTSPSQGT